jgi:hypothetical protein
MAQPQEPAPVSVEAGMHTTFQRVCLLGGAAATFAGAAFAVGAGAQTAMPAPDCTGMSVTDDAGDAKRVDPASPQKSPDNFDILGLFFTSEGGKTYANLQLADGSDTIPDGAQGARWYVTFTAKGAQRFVRASHNVVDGETTFSYGHYEDTTRTPDGDIAGKFIAGKPGILQLPIPAAAGGADGTALTKPFAETDEAVLAPNTAPGVGYTLFANDLAPNEEGTFGKDYTVGGCSAGGGGTTGGTPDGGAGGGTPGSGTPGGGAPGGGGPVTETAALPVKASGKGGSAKKASKKKKLRLALESSQPVSELVARLFKGDPAKPKVSATGRLAALSGKGSITLKVAKRLKKGTYALRIDGKLADGRQGVANFKVKLGK